MRTNRNALAALAIMLVSGPVFAQGLVRIAETGHFIFLGIKGSSYPAYEEEFEASYAYLERLFRLDRHGRDKIEVRVHPSQKAFVRDACGGAAWVTSVGMAESDKGLVHITSYLDGSTGRDLEEYRRVARHELTHVLMPNDAAWLSEGLALYAADQSRELIEVPGTIEDLLVYIDCNIYNKAAYGIYSFMTRAVIESRGLNAYLGFYLSGDYAALGYGGKRDFASAMLSALKASSGGR